MKFAIKVGIMICLVILGSHNAKKSMRSKFQVREKDVDQVVGKSCSTADDCKIKDGPKLECYAGLNRCVFGIGKPCFESNQCPGECKKRNDKEKFPTCRPLEYGNKCVHHSWGSDCQTGLTCDEKAHECRVDTNFVCDANNKCATGLECNGGRCDGPLAGWFVKKFGVYEGNDKGKN